MSVTASPRLSISRRPSPRADSVMRRIVADCFPWRYGNDYVPAILATRSSGPSQGRLHELPMPGWKRSMQFLSAAEMRIAAWVIYQPEYIEALENRPCLPIPGFPILDGHPLLDRQELPGSSGTAEIARRIGIRHPMTTANRDICKDPGSRRSIDFFPLISDLLAIFKFGPSIRAVNLFVKKRLADLELGGRHADLYRLESAYYAEGSIPTYKISEEQLDPLVTNNLVRVIKLGVLPNDVSVDRINEVINYMESRLYSSAPVSWCGDLQESMGLPFHTIFRIFHYGVLRRRLKVNLREAVAMDRIHRPETINYARDFASRFLEPLR